jgi:hypothetical protein
MAFPQLTREQMLERCDLAGVACVVSIGRASHDSPNLAKLTFVHVVKGAPRERDGFVYVRLHGGGAPRHDGSLVAWSDWWDYPVGTTVMTHLDWNGPEEVYETTWPGAVSEVEGDVARVA